jgi:hypothetical protein
MFFEKRNKFDHFLWHDRGQKPEQTWFLRDKLLHQKRQQQQQQQQIQQQDECVHENGHVLHPRVRGKGRGVLTCIKLARVLTLTHTLPKNTH